MAILKKCEHTELGAACNLCDGQTEAPKRKHRATYATDKRKGGYLIRISGPTPEAFVGREVPVTLRDGTEHPERLTGLVWTGVDAQTQEKVALYKFESRPREKAADTPF
jgi:hypothetical protein